MTDVVGSGFVDTGRTAAGAGLVLPIGSRVGSAIVKVSVPVMGVWSTG